MAKTIPIENLAHARAFIEKFGIGEKHVPIDQFDMFLIDRGMAQDPGTSDVKDNAYRGFVQQRGAARRLLNTAGAWINGSSFQISVNGRNEGYSVVKWALDSNEYARQITDQVRIYTASRIANLEQLRNKAKALLIKGHDDDGLHTSLKLLSSMAGHGLSMQAKIAGHLKQYDTAYAMVVADMEKAIQAQLEEDNSED